MVDVTDVVNEALDLALHAPVLELHLAQLVRAHDRLAAAVRRAALLGCKHVRAPTVQCAHTTATSLAYSYAHAHAALSVK